MPKINIKKFSRAKTPKIEETVETVETVETQDPEETYEPVEPQPVQSKGFGVIEQEDYDEVDDDDDFLAEVANDRFVSAAEIEKQEKETKKQQKEREAEEKRQERERKRYEKSLKDAEKNTLKGETMRKRQTRVNV